MMMNTSFSRRAFLERMAALGLVTRAYPFAGPADMERPLCVFSKHLQWLDYNATAETAAEIGFDGVDLAVRPGGHVLPERVEEDLPKAVEAMKQAGLQVPMMTTAITNATDPHTEPVLKTAAEQGIRYYRMGYLRYRDDESPADTLRGYREQLAALGELNAKYGLHGAYQNHSGTRVGGPVWDLWILLEGQNADVLGCQYDIRHAVVEGGTAWPLGLRQLQPYIRTTVLKDFKWAQDEDGRWRIRNTPIGEGMVDFGRYFEQVREAEISGPISVHFEYEMPEDDLPLEQRRRETISLMRQDLDAIRSLMKDAGL